MKSYKCSESAYFDLLTLSWREKVNFWKSRCKIFAAARNRIRIRQLQNTLNLSYLEIHLLSEKSIITSFSFDRVHKLWGSKVDILPSGKNRQKTDIIRYYLTMPFYMALYFECRINKNALFHIFDHISVLNHCTQCTKTVSRPVRSQRRHHFFWRVKTKGKFEAFWRYFRRPYILSSWYFELS